MRLVFMGTPEFAAIILRRLIAAGEDEIVGVYTQPDRPAGRGMEIRSSPVKQTALEYGIPVYQPANFRNPDDLEELAALKPDMLLVAAYGLILPRSVLDVPLFGAYNAHASLLPRYRGAAPIERAIMAGDPMTGITIMRMEENLDAGPILMQRAIPIDNMASALQVHDELADLGAELMFETLRRIKRQDDVAAAQDHASATYAPKLTKEEGWIEWSRPAAEIHNRIRGVTPRPGAYTDLLRPGHPAQRVGLEPGRIGEPLPAGIKPGSIGALKNGRLPVACADRWYLLERLRPAGRKTMSAAEFANGRLKGAARASFVCADRGQEE